MKRLVSFLTALSMMCTLFAGIPVSAQEQDAETTEQTAVLITDDSLPDSAELETLYINSLFYGGGFSFYKDYGHTFTGARRELYDLLRAEIEKIAAGTLTTTSISLSMSKSFDTSNTDVSGELRIVVDALKADLPQDLYWFDKTAGYIHYKNNTGDKIAKVIFNISKDYVLLPADGGAVEDVNFGNGNIKTYNISVDNTKMQKARTAAANAQAIAASYSSATAYEKILAFRDEICNLTEYNEDAANENIDTPYGDPWQLVWVFDGDTSTNVVCEGYSKAFQYLCDLSGVECYTVSGIMAGGTGAGRHMWNIVVLDGKSYLVDITNCDDKTVGNPDKLLLKGAAESSGTGCKFTNTNPNMTYTYDESIVSLYTSKILTVSTESYEPPAAVPTITVPKKHTAHWNEDSDSFTISCSFKNIADTSKIQAAISGSIADVEISDINSEKGTFNLTITCKDKGTAKITVTYEDDSKATAECELTLHKWADKLSYDKTGHWYACGECTEKGEKSSHNMEADETTKEEATCTEDGKEADEKCSDCDYTVEGAVIEATGHDMVEVDGTAKEATCKEEGKEADKKCQNKNCDYTETGKTIEKKPHTPGEPKQENVENATCTAAGSYDEVTYCEICEEKLDTKHITGKTLPHEMEEVADSAKAPTCTEPGKEADKKCKNCDYTETGAAIKATGHTEGEPVKKNVVDASCTVKGSYDEVVCCETCGEELSRVHKEGVMLDHTPGEAVHEKETAATCTAEGSYEEVIYCTKCNTEISRTHKTIDKLSHTPAEPVKENDVEATCTENGSYDLVTKCSVCGEVTETKHVVVPSTGHDIASAWVQGETTHYQECTVCHEKLGEASHTKDGGNVTVPPTADTEGTRTYSCTICGKVLETAVIPALGEGHEHSYTIINSNESGHWNECECGEKEAVVPHSADTREEIVQEASCIANGLKYVTTYCTECNREISKESEVIPATGTHNYEDGVCTICGTHCEHDFVNGECTICGVPCEHDFVDGECTICGAHCEHNFVNGECTICGAEDPDYEEPCDHNFVNGVCTKCGENDPSYVPPVTPEVPEKPETPEKPEKPETPEVPTVPDHTHTYGAAWYYNGASHWHECVCGDRADEALHTANGGTVTKQPTASETGIRSYYCTVCRAFMYDEVIPVISEAPSTGTDNAPEYSNGSSSSSAPSSSASKEPFIQGSSGNSGWTAIEEEIRNTGDGSTITVNMNGATQLPKKVVSEIAGKDIDLVLNMGSYSWTINGKSVTKAKAVDMSVRKISKIPAAAVSDFFGNTKTIQLDLRHNGDLGFVAVLTIDVGSKYDGKFANLYCYKSKNFEYADSSEIVNGKANLRFAHASSWIIAIEDSPALEDVSSAAAGQSSEAPIDFAGSAGSRMSLAEFIEGEKFRVSTKKRRYRIIRKDRIDDLVFVL